MIYFFVESFVKGTTIYVNFRLELTPFSAQNLDHIFNTIGINCYDW